MNNLEIISAILNMFYLSTQSCGAPKHMPYLGGRLAKANFFLFVCTSSISISVEVWTQTLCCPQTGATFTGRWLQSLEPLMTNQQALNIPGIPKTCFVKLLPQAALQNSTNEEMNTQFGPNMWQHFQDNIGFKSIIIAPMSACKCHRRSRNNLYREHILFLRIRKNDLTSLPLLGLMLSKTRHRVQLRFLFFSAGLGLHLVSQLMKIYSCFAFLFFKKIFNLLFFLCTHPPLVYLYVILPGAHLLALCELSRPAIN